MVKKGIILFFICSLCYAEGIVDIKGTSWKNIPSNLIPSKTCTYDFGSSTYNWKDAYFNGTVTGVDATFTGLGTFDKLSLTNTANTYDDISFANQQFWFYSLYTPTPAPVVWGIAANDGNDLYLMMIADGGDTGGGVPTIELRANHSTTTSVLRSQGAPLDIHANDFNDYIRFQTLSNIPEITTVGTCDLKISSSEDIWLNANVGIGTSAPTVELDVVGDVSLTGTATAGGFDDGTLKITDGNLVTTGDITIDSDSSLLYLGDNQGQTIGADANSLNIIANAVTGADTLQLTAGDFVFNTGQIGVGKTPTYLLDVTGSHLGLRIHRDANNAGFSVWADWALDNGAGEVTTYSQIRSIIRGNTDGSEDGELSLRTMQGGTLTEALSLDKVGQINIPKGNFQIDPSGPVGSDVIITTIGGGVNHFKATNTATSGQFAGAGFQFFSSDGAALADGDRLGFLTFGGSYDASNTANAVAITAYAEGAWSSGDIPAGFQFETTPVGAGSRIARMTIANDGAVTVGTDGTGYDVKFYGDTAGSYLLWDESEDELVIEEGDLTVKDDTPRITSWDTGTDYRYSWHGGDATELSGFNNYALLRHDVGAANLALMYWDNTNNLNIGNSPTGSYSQFEPDGTLKFVGEATVWDDVNVSLITAKVPAVNFPTWAIFSANLNSYTFAVDDYADLSTAEILHNYKEGTDIYIHIHLVTNGEEAGDTKAQYTIYYSWGDMDEAMSAEGSLTSEKTITGGTTDKTHLFLGMGAVTGTNYKIGSLLKLRVERIAKSAGGADPAADPFVEQVGIHYEMDTVGSSQELIK